MNKKTGILAETDRKSNIIYDKGTVNIPFWSKLLYNLSSSKIVRRGGKKLLS